MYERMLNKTTQPTHAEMEAFCGECGKAFLCFNRYLDEELGCMSEIRFPYGNSYGWSVTHRRGKKLVCDVFAEAGAFSVMIRLTNKALDDIYPSLSEYAQKCVDVKYPCGEGGWLHYRVSEPEQLEDIKRLAALKFN